MDQTTNGVSRRKMLKTMGIGGGIAAVSFSTLFAGAESAFAQPISGKAHDAMDTPETMANLAATAETLAATSYFYTLRDGDFQFSDREREILKLAMHSELWHLAILQSLGGKALANEFYVPANFLTDFGVNTQTFIAAETAFTGAYLAATRRFCDLDLPRLAVTTAQHAATEAEHLALTRLIGGLVPNPNALPPAIYYNVSDAGPTLAPFITGGEGFIGPVPFPGVDAILASLEGTEAILVPPFAATF